MAQSLAAHGWPMGIEVLKRWKAHLAEELDLTDEASRFDEWIESIQLSADLARDTAGRALPSGPAIRV